jgi:glutamate-1-semialdehyde aminotransferase
MAGLAFRGEAPHDRYHKIPHQGTHNANPLSARVGVAVLGAVEGGEPNRRAAEAGARLMAAANAVFRKEGLPWRVYGERSILHLTSAFTDADARAFDTDGEEPPAEAFQRPQPPERKLLDAALLLSGVDLPPGGQAWTSIAHGEAEAEAFAGALRDAVGILRETGGLA